MKLGITGTRTYSDLAQVREFVRALPPGTVVVTGGADGVDDAAEDEAFKAGLPVVTIRPDYRTFKKGTAEHERNRRVVGEADAVVAFWEPPGDGTLDTIKLARAAGKLREVHRPRVKA